MGARVGIVGRGGGSGVVKLGAARYAGDIFTSPASTLFIQHGHTGIYFNTAIVVEAPGLGRNSRSIAASALDVGAGTTKESVKVSIADSAKVGKYAYDNLVGKPYNPLFSDNKYGPPLLNCSQLVWWAYIKTLNVDLDYNGGPGVYPYDIQKSPKVTIYATV